MPTKRPLLVEKLRPHYETYAEWLQEEHELTVPPDHLQVALSKYAEFQKSDFNKAAKAERAKERESAKASETKTATKRSRKAAEDEDDEDDEEEAAPPAKTTARKAPAKRAPRGSKASF